MRVATSLPAARPRRRVRPAVTPAARGYRMPAEWEPHAATWLSWPHNASDWPGKLPAIGWVYAEMVRKLAPGERVRLLVHSAPVERAARRALAAAGVPEGRVEYWRVPTDRGWTRDLGPIFVRRAGRDPLAIVDFHFNAWARYPDWRRDDAVAGIVARRRGLRRFRPEHGGRRLVLEGGAVDVNGRGTVITTEECLLSDVQARNPGLGRAGTERALGQWLGAPHVIWLGRGIAGDDTHGHVDDVCRFVDPRTVVLVQEDDPADENHAPLRENRERLEGARLQDGSRLQVVPLPMPAPLVFRGQRLPASYANFYVGNAAVIVPTFNDPNDRIALGTLAELFRDRTVVGIHAVDLVWGLGTLHCLTQQEPALVRAAGAAGGGRARPARGGG